MKAEATPSTSRDGTQGACSPLGAYTTISANILRYQRSMQHMPMTGETSNVDGVTDNGSTRYQHLGSTSIIYNTRPSTSRASMEEASVNTEDGVTNAPGTGGKEQRELCGVCGNVSRRHGHAKEATDDTAHICKACGISYVKESKLVQHCRNRTGQKHKCETCGELLHRADHLAEDYRTHTDERPYKCNICDKSFRRSNHLDKHKRTHTDERAYKCQICDKSFRQSHHLDIHKRTHTNERPYKCQLCDKSFRQSSHLNNRKRTHTDERPYKCEICDKSFRRSTHLDNHKRHHTREKPYICKTCGKSYTRVAYLRKHQYAHAEEKRVTSGMPKMC
ncbi:uncharacterized protein [Dermacentor andersoni]|uniref:uncharacterized protein n=1 Tax=Dermacentor andersoni TaxID=34620 RepID=UPI003B3B540D